MIARLLLVSLLPLLQDSTTEGAAPAGTAQATEAKAPAAPFVFDRGEDQPPLLLPREETLVYRARVEFGILDASVGTVTQTSTVEADRPSVLLLQVPKDEDGDGPKAERATVRLHAKGDYQLYSMDSVIESHLHPQEWPRVSYSQRSQGTEKRRREIRMGLQEGKYSASYRKDTSKNAPKGTRIWGEQKFREIPEGTLDMLTAVFMTRRLITEEEESLTFPVIDKLKLWEVTLRRGKEKRMRTAAGVFDVVEVLLEPGPFPGETIDPKKKERFKGLFGIHGTIHLFVEKNTGIPVRIQGDLPAGPFTLGIDVELGSYSGTPEAFGPVGPPSTRGKVKSGR